jgi:Ser/Thr protein kinase RdoA (MazF antagonist)
MSSKLWGDKETEYFFEITPEKILEAVESAGFKVTGRCLPLNSMENRVYEVELEWESDTPPEKPSDKFRIVKFYRPGRWSENQINDEHQFLLELKAAEIPAIAPLLFADGKLN